MNDTHKLIYTMASNAIYLTYDMNITIQSRKTFMKSHTDYNSKDNLKHLPES